ncbi:serine/threonine-protein kinase Chk2-like [Hylaeus anthracinus]|uniref:serine/threonine-protein kinase Chk2-like n=1 Tax=Hylaeus volcanicus TaxID=313075 RepID=UPI0023B8627A|nr:serine/threonine-protein kinase Chk2-like [Hylaeus volcanicus]XP_053987690.1 serine/threonine-protein kinase Chk2-like [Hylaeus volcanicus]XP_054007917.1 serine/threonine-protein kinase Chk2-like [Hylaeus anthracinus]XP_054007918.1 serine/threonine-protein kinase Chk2-like [Hylaeus anthracinus]
MNDEHIVLTLPDTQSTDSVCLTQSQALSQEQTMIVWGRLCPIPVAFKTVEMIRDVYTLGRSEKCDIPITENELKPKWLSVISKIHFRITREFINENNKDTVIYLEDLSQNGTFVNKKKVGRGKKVVLESNDIISLAQSHVSVYVFMSTIAFECNDLPVELRSKYAVSRKLGSGACGEVKLVFSKVGCKKFAMKTIMKLGDGTNGQRHPLNDPEKIMNEVRILKALKHPCVVRLEEIVDSPKAVYIVLELMEGGELFERIKSRGKLSEKTAKLIFYQVVLAVSYLHDSGITHRDLKPENILLASDSDVTLAKVSDFGLSKLVDAQTMMKTFCGTPMYVAPEILFSTGRGSYTNQVDVWSLGVILYACLSGSVPFNCHDKNSSLQDQIMRGCYSFPVTKFGHVSEKAIDLIKRMMTTNPKKRITIKQVLLHPWLQDRELRDTMDILLSVDNEENIIPSNIPSNCQYKNEKYQRLRKRARLDT